METLSLSQTDSKNPKMSAKGRENPGGEESRGNVNTDLWHACAGPLVSLPSVGTLVLYFPQGHSEQVSASMQRDVHADIPNYSNLPSNLVCLLHNITLQADSETDEVYAQMTLQPVNVSNKDAFLASDHGLNTCRPQTELFCKTLTASDTSTHGGFSVPRRAAEKIFPPLDFSMQPPVQELHARDLHGNVWNFRHIYRGQPKRHLLTTGWSLFVSGKRLVAGDSVLFIRDEKSQLLLGIKRANKQSNNISSSVLSSDSMHIGIFAAAAHAAANNSPFTVFYNPRASPSEFVVPFAKYNRSIYGNHISLGMRFRMLFETEESGTRRFMGTVIGISDLDPLRWKGSQWRNLQIGWDESVSGERQNRVSVWEIEPVVSPFFICPPPFFRSKLPRRFEDNSSDMENVFKKFRPWIGEEIIIKDSQSQNTNMHGLSLAQWMNVQQNHLLANSNMQQNQLSAISNTQEDYMHSLTEPALQNLGASDISNQSILHDNIQFNGRNSLQQIQQINQMAKMSLVPSNQLDGTTHQQSNGNLQQRQNLVNQTYPLGQTNNPTQCQVLIPTHIQQQQHLIQNLQPPQSNFSLNQLQQFKVQQQSQMPNQIHQQINQTPQLFEQEIQVQLMQNLQQQQQSFHPHPILQTQQIQQQQQNLLKDSQNFVNTYSISQRNIGSQQMSRNNTLMEDHSSQNLQKHQNQSQQKQVIKEGLSGMIPPTTNQFSPITSCVPTTRVTQLGTVNDDPSCSASPSANVGQVHSQKTKCNTFSGPVAIDGIPHSTVNSCIFEARSATPNTSKNRQKKESKVKPPQVKLGSAPQMDFLDSSSSATSCCLPQADKQLQQDHHLSSFNSQSMFHRNPVSESNIQAADPQNDNLFRINIDNTCTSDILPPSDCLGVKDVHLGNDYLNNFSSGNMLANDNSKEAQRDATSSFVSQTFGVQDIGFNSIPPAINDSSYLNRSSWAPPSQPQKMRTYTKVYKHGAVGRSIDVTRYSGYTELKRDLVRMFSIGDQIDDLQKIGWKLVYVDQENDVLLVGDDPWEEFVSCVQCIRILSPQEVQQMSLDGDLDNSILPNQVHSSSDGGNVWREENDLVNNPSTLSYNNFG